MDRNYRVMCEVLDKAAEAHRRRRAYDFDDFRVERRSLFCPSFNHQEVG